MTPLFAVHLRDHLLVHIGQMLIEGRSYVILEQRRRKLVQQDRVFVKPAGGNTFGQIFLKIISVDVFLFPVVGGTRDGLVYGIDIPLQIFGRRLMLVDTTESVTEFVNHDPLILRVRGVVTKAIRNSWWADILENRKQPDNRSQWPTTTPDPR